MDTNEKWAAVIARDRRYDGKFFYGVRSTGIFCCPSCASKRTRLENAVFFDSREEAEAAGFRPCKRCLPELASCAPAEECFAQMRLRRAKKLLDEGNGIADTAFAVGMESPASFSAFFKKYEGVSPLDYAAQRAEAHPSRFCDTPLGPVRITEDRRGITSLKFAESGTGPAQAGPAGLYLEDAVRQLSEYFAGVRKEFHLPLSTSGSPFQEKVWSALRDIPYGETRCYQQIAQMTGSGKAARAVGMANNRNPILILIPCHRVVGKDGKLVGYAAGIDRKQYLLDLEAPR